MDQDISLVRGLLQGWPKKIGSTWLTRSLPLATPAAAPLENGSRLGASLSVKDRRLLEARLTLTGTAGKPYGFFANRYVGLVGLPNLSQLQNPTMLTLKSAVISNTTVNNWHDASASLSFLAHPYEELSILGEVNVYGASAGWVGLTVVGTEDV